MTPELKILGRWSIGVQWASVALVAVFFAVLTRTIRLREVRLWASAWLADVLALTLAFVSYFVAEGPVARLAATGYALAKTCFVVLLIVGARQLLRPGASRPLMSWRAAAAFGAWGLLLGLLPMQIAHVTLLIGLGVLALAVAVSLLRPPRTAAAVASGWLGAALAVEGLLFLHYLPVIAIALWKAGGQVGEDVPSSPGAAAPYFAVSSFIDAGVETLVALASLVALADRVANELRQANAGLLTAQDELRRLADVDPLTGLPNRRRLQAVLKGASPAGATVLFFDLDGFKEINDRHGHAVGDASLARFAGALTRAFRPWDTVIRYAGDEFLVVAPGMDVEDCELRVESLRWALASPDPVSLAFSVGLASLEPGGDPEAVVREADERMYHEKRGGGDRRLARA